MKAVRLHTYGDVDQFRLGDAPDPVLGTGDVLIRIAVIGLNLADLYVRQGFFAAHVPLDLPAIMEFDVAGLVAPEDANTASRIRIHNTMAREDPAIFQRIPDVARGDLMIPIARRFGLGEVAQAHLALAAGQRGKIVLTVT